MQLACDAVNRGHTHTHTHTHTHRERERDNCRLRHVGLSICIAADRPECVWASWAGSSHPYSSHADHTGPGLSSVTTHSRPLRHNTRKRFLMSSASGRPPAKTSIARLSQILYCATLYVMSNQESLKVIGNIWEASRLPMSRADTSRIVLY